MTPVVFGLVLLAAVGVAAVLGVAAGVLVPRRVVDRVPFVVDEPAGEPGLPTIPPPSGLRSLEGADDLAPEPPPLPEAPSTVPGWMRGALVDALTAGGVPVAPSPTCTCGNLAQIEAAWRDLVARPLPPIAYLSEDPRVEFRLAERAGLAVTAPDDGRYGPRVAAELDRAKDAAARRRGVTWPRSRS